MSSPRGRESSYCSSRGRHIQTSIDSPVVIRQVRANQSLLLWPVDTHRGYATVHTSPRHTPFIRNAVIIAPLSRSPVWHPYLKYVFSGKKHTLRFSSSANRPSNPRGRTDPTRNKDSNIYQILTRVSAVHVHISASYVVWNEFKIKHFPVFDQKQRQLTSSWHPRELQQLVDSLISEK